MLTFCFYEGFPGIIVEYLSTDQYVIEYAVSSTDLALRSYLNAALLMNKFQYNYLHQYFHFMGDYDYYIVDDVCGAWLNVVYL